MSRRVQYAAVILIVVGLLFSVYVNTFRFAAEQENKTVQVLIDYDELESLAFSQGKSLGELSAQFKEAGATGVIVRERTLDELQRNGDIAILSGGEASLLLKLNAGGVLSLGRIFLEPRQDYTYIITENKALYETIVQTLGAIGKEFDDSPLGQFYLIAAHFNEKEREKLGLGFTYEDLEDIHRGGLDIVPRFRDYAKANDAAIEALREDLAKMPGLQMITFNDPAIPGTGNIPYLAEKIKEVDVPVGMFEFFNQAGLNTLARQIDKNVIRVHSISETDMANYNETTAAERFRLAVAERNIRALYVRLFGLEHPSTSLERSLNFIKLVNQSIEQEGFSSGSPEPLGSIPYSRIIVLLIGLGVIGGGLLCCNLLFTERWSLLLGILALLGWAGLLFVQPMLARKVFALGSVIVFPVVSIIMFVRKESRTLAQAVLAFLMMSALSFAGAVLMTGLLADKSFMLTLDLFSGVKVAHAIPLVLVAAWFLLYDTDFRVSPLLNRIKNILDAPVQTKHLVVGFIVAAALGLYLIRTGNDAPQLVSSYETALRELLDKALGVRPRTKEFLLGHPAMLVLLYYGWSRSKIAVLLLAVIGQISLVNTYAHIHTPWLVSLTRSFHGIWMGIIIGVIIIICLDFLLKFLRKESAFSE